MHGRQVARPAPAFLHHKARLIAIQCRAAGGSRTGLATMITASWEKHQVHGRVRTRSHTPYFRRLKAQRERPRQAAAASVLCCRCCLLVMNEGSLCREVTCVLPLPPHAHLFNVFSPPFLLFSLYFPLVSCLLFFMSYITHLFHIIVN